MFAMNFPVNTDWVENLYRQHSQLVFHYVKKMAYRDKRDTSLAEDITQETFLLAQKNYDKLQDHPNMPGWLLRAALNIYRNESKKSKLNIALPIESMEIANIAEEEKTLLRLSLETILSTLSRSDYELIYNHAVLGKSIGELSSEKNVTYNSINLRLFKIRQKLRNIKE